MTRRTRSMILCISISSTLWAEARAQAPHPRSDKAPPGAPLPGITPGDARAVVLFFIASDCPISNRLLPEMLQIQHKFAERRVRFYFVYPNSTETAATIRTHRAAYGIEDNVLTDPHEDLSRFASANVTPEAAILVPDAASLKTVYVGRIDDRYISLGTERPAATRHDLEEAISAVLANHSVPAPGGPPVGCAFMALNTK